MKILITGAAGFIGFHVAKYLCRQGDEVVGLDNLNSYYDVHLKQARLQQLTPLVNFHFVKIGLTDKCAMAALFTREQFDRVIHLAAQAGVRYSIDHPMAYGDSNLSGYLTILEGCRLHPVEHLIYASSSSVYGLNHKVPFSINDNVDHPVSLYAATKKSNELMAHAYAHLYQIPTTGLRLFTVYGPWGRPDMALFKFTRAMLKGEAIEVYNHGDMARDFTYIDDIVEGIARVQDCIPQANPEWTEASGDIAHSTAPYQIFNLGHGQPVQLLDFIDALERALGIKANKHLLPMQAGDVGQTCAEVDDLFNAIGYCPQTGINEGVQRFVDWYREYYGSHLAGR